MLRDKPSTKAMSSYHILQVILLHEAPDYIGAHRIKLSHFYFILIVSSGLGMCDRLNFLLCAVIQRKFNLSY